MYKGMMLAGRYELTSKIGEGGMGQVWRGADTKLRRPIAVKLLPRPTGTDPRTVERFMREATITAGLQHPAITVVFDFDTQTDPRGDVVYLVMELLDGTDLASVMEQNPRGLPPDQILSVGVQVADALAAAHAQGVVHRDIKPGNIIRLAEERVKLCDFGIARYSGEVTGLTGGLPIGTPAYMAPEQFENNDGLDARADLYALGGTLFMLATGREPFTAGNLHALMNAVLNEPPHDPREFRPDLPAPLADLIVTLLAKSPDGRLPNAHAVRDRLRQFTAALASATGVGDLPPTRRLTVVPDLTSAQRAALQLYEQSRYEEALEHFRQAAEVRGRVLGEDHPDTLASRVGEGWTLYWLDREAEALPLAERAAAVRARHLGARHPDTLEARDLMARCLYGLDRFGEALPVLREVARAHAQVCGTDDPQTLHDRSLMARTLLGLSRPDEALPIAAETADGRARVLGPEHPDTLASRNLVGRSLYALGRYAEALPVFEAVTDARARVLGPDHPDTERSAGLAARTLRQLSA